MVLATFRIRCQDCAEEWFVGDWELARTMLENDNGHTGYRFVYLIEFTCTCGLQMTVEAQGYMPPNQEVVERWHYRFFDCEVIETVSQELLI